MGCTGQNCYEGRWPVAAESVTPLLMPSVVLTAEGLSQPMGHWLPFFLFRAFLLQLSLEVFLFMFLYLEPSSLSLSPQLVSSPLLSDTTSLFKRGHYSCHRWGSTSTSLRTTFILHTTSEAIVWLFTYPSPQSCCLFMVSNGTCPLLLPESLPTKVAAFQRYPLVTSELSGLCFGDWYGCSHDVAWGCRLFPCPSVASFVISQTEGLRSFF